MKKLCLWAISMLICSLAFSQSQTSFKATDQTDADIQKLVNFLTSPKGAVYMGTAGKLNNRLLPLSYYSTPKFWADYICTQQYGGKCAVVDVYNDCPGGKCPEGHQFTFTPQGPFGKIAGDEFKSEPADLQVERVNVFSGSNIYDASTWQIALALGSVNGLKGWQNGNLAEMVDNQNILLQVGYDGNATNIVEGSNRAVTSGKLFKYNQTPVSTPNKAFYFRMIPKAWEAEDPFKYGYVNNITSKTRTGTGQVPKNFPPGTISWLDWKPIAGENAWAFYLGALQAEYILSTQNKTNFDAYKAKPESYKLNPDLKLFNRTAIQNALPLLDTFSYMQSKVGGIFYVPGGSLGNVGDQQVDPTEVSVENNASALAGFHVFANMIEQLKKDKSLDANSQKIVNYASCRLDTLIYGGETADGRPTEGLLSFFANQAWDGKVFIQGGHADKNGNPWVAKPPANEPKAVDVTTWGIAAIGPKNLDEWKGFGASYKAWQEVKSWGSFKHNGELWGVGYSDKDKHLVMSAEWTAGAINMVRMLIHHYESIDSKNSNYNAALGYVRELKQDESTMSRNLLNLRTDKYPALAKELGSEGLNYNELLSLGPDYLAYIYANKRYFIPFGWFANPLPSTTSVAWPVMLYYQFNPFTWGGGYGSNVYKKNAKVQGSCGASAILPETKVQVTPYVKDAAEIAVSGCKKDAFSSCTGGDWGQKPLLVMKTQNVAMEGDVQNKYPNTKSVPAAQKFEMTIPAGTKFLSVSFHKQGMTQWYGSCNLEMSPDNVGALSSGAIFAANWHNNGQGACHIIRP